MKKFSFLAAFLLSLVTQSADAQKLLLSHVAINPGQGLLWITRDGGFLAKYGLSAEIVFIPGSPRSVQSLLAGDIDFAVAGAPAPLRARMQGGDSVILSSTSPYVSQRLVLRLDSPITSLKELRGKTIGVTQYGSAGDAFLRAALKKTGLKDSEVVILQMGATTSVAQALEAGKIEVGVLGDSSSLLFYRGKAKPLKGGSSKDLGFLGLDGPLSTTERKIKNDRGTVVRFMQAYVEAVHLVKTNRASAVKIYSKYLRGLSDEHLGLWVDELRENIKPLPYPDENSLRAELDQISTNRAQPDSYFVNTSILDDVKKTGLVEKLYKQ